MDRCIAIYHKLHSLIHADDITEAVNSRKSGIDLVAGVHRMQMRDARLMVKHADSDHSGRSRKPFHAKSTKYTALRKSAYQVSRCDVYALYTGSS